MPFASVLGESEAEALKRRMKERSAITSLDAPAKKENKRLCKELSLRFQRAKEKLEDGTKKLDKQVLSQQSLASDKTVKEDSVHCPVNCRVCRRVHGDSEGIGASCGGGIRGSSGFPGGKVQFHTDGGGAEGGEEGEGEKEEEKEEEAIRVVG